MNLRRWISSWAGVGVLLMGAVLADAAENGVAELKEAPRGFSPEVTAALSATGYRITSKGGVVCDVWLAREVALKPNFKASLRVQYPFQPGQLMGAIQFPAAATPNDFRGQPFAAGAYTLRYGLQPDDGNHLGTSDIRDFLLACPSKFDVDSRRVATVKDLFQLSAKAAGTTHPTIFLLNSPPDQPLAAPMVEHDAEKEYLILKINAPAKSCDIPQRVPLSIVLIGKSAA